MYQSILITGASSGLGASLAEAYAANNVSLCLLGRDQKRLENMRKTCEAKGAQVETACIDVQDKTAMFAWLVEHDEKNPFDLVIANAGISNGGEVMTMDASEHIFSININGVLNTLHPLIPRMQKRQSGHLVIMSSLAGFRGLPRAPAYSASKAAIRVYGDALHGMLAKDGITVSVICPGFVKTPLTDKNPFKMPFMMSAEKATNIITKALARKKTHIIFPWIMYLAVRFLALLPTTWARRITQRL